ncbi:MAG TPA: ABC transporter substrate-binding protein [bacterium]
MKRRVFLALALAVFAAALLAAPVLAAKYDTGATDKEIKIGHIGPYSGPASAYGTIGRAIGAYFTKINEEGGINGRKINFITYDDGYSPPKTMEQARRLVEQDNVLLLFQTLGTPPNTAIHKYMNQKQIPQLFVASGATKWGDPKHFPWTMGWQPSYQTEAVIYAKYILKNYPNGKIGVLYQNDDYGKDYLKGLEDGLGAKASSMIVSKLSYEVTDPTVDSQVVALKNSGANVFFDVSGPKFAAQAIRKAAEIGWKPAHILNGVSISIKAVLEPAGLENSKGIVSSTYGKDADDPEWANDPGILEWKRFMAKYYPDGSIHDASNVYGYAVAMTMVHVLKNCGDDLTRANVMKQAANIKGLVLPTALPGMPPMTTSPTNFYPIRAMQMQKFNGKTWERFGDIITSD